MGPRSRGSTQPQRNVQVRVLIPADPTPLRMPYRFLTSDVPGAKADLQESLVLNPALTQSLVKLASVHMEQGDNKAALESFERAIETDASDPDVYYHRGQGMLSPLVSCLMLKFSACSSLHHQRLCSSR